MEKLKLSALGERLKMGGERLKTGGAEMGRKVSGKVKEILQGQSQEAKMVDEATSENLTEPNWGLNLRICALLNGEELHGPEVMRSIKKKIASKNEVSQMLSLDLLEACAMNCDKVFSEVASEKVVDDMVKMIDNPQTHSRNRQRALQLIKAWGESEDLAYLPVFQQTYMNLKSRNVLFERDDHLNEEGISSVEGRIYEPSSFPQGYPLSHINNESGEAYDVGYVGLGLSIEEKKEILVVTRNTLEVLSSILNSNAPPEAMKDDLTLGMLEKCKDSQQVIQRITETAGDDEEILFEALNLHEELEQVLSKYAEMEAASTPPNGGPSLEHRGSANSSWEGEAAVNAAAGNIEETVPASNSRKAGGVQNADKNEPSSN